MVDKTKETEEKEKDVKVNKKEKAIKAIQKELDSKEITYSEETIASVCDALYEKYETDETIPTREAFAEICEDKTISDAVIAMEKDPFIKKSSKRRIVALIVACVVIAALAGVGIGIVTNSDNAEASVIEEEYEDTYILSVGVSAEGWDAETSTPVIAHIVNEELDIDYYHAYDANSYEELIVENSDSYTISFISSINADGSIYSVPEEQSIEIYVDGDEGIIELPYTFELISADDVATDELTEIVTQITEAIANGDETLTGENGEAIAEKAGTNAVANENADEDAIEAETETAVETSKSSSSAKTGNTTSSTSTSNSTSSTKSSTTSSNSTSSSSKSSSSSSSSGSSSSNSSSSHTHNWVAQTENVYETVYHEAEYKWVLVCNHCSGQFDNNNDISNHWQELLLSGVRGNISYYNTKILIQEAYSEEKLVDTITTSYKCSGCGATKSA